MELDRESVIFLIQKYQEHQLLWDPKDKWHFNKVKKKDAWQDIANSVGIQVEDAKKKMSSLLGSFRREKSKGKRLIGSGKGASEVYKSDWFAFKSFAFLIEKENPRETINSEQTAGSVTEVQITDADSESGTTCEETAEKTTEITPSSEKNDGAKPPTPRKKAKVAPSYHRREDPRIEMAYKILQHSTEREDATTKYALYLAEKLNQFDPITKSTLIHKFNTLIFEAEMNMYAVSPSPDKTIASQPFPSSSSCQSRLESTKVVIPSPSISPSHILKHLDT